MFYKKHKAYKFGSQVDLSQPILDNLTPLFSSKNPEKPATILTGRTGPTITDIDGIGSVVIKHYLRGGFISYFNKSRYLFSKKSRAELEFIALLDAMSAGVNVPEPIAYVSCGSLFYKTWLITKEIGNTKNFVELIQNEKDRAVSLLPAINANINKLITASIHHVDLHPGNIIVDKFDKPFILDFDKACCFSGGKKKLVKKYKLRWQRAINKYKLPIELSHLELK
jgi:hypothetical protein